MMNETFLDHTHLVPQKHTTPSLNPIHIHLYIFVSSYTPVSYLTYTCTPYSLPTLLFLHLLQFSYVPVPTPIHLYILQSSYTPVPTPPTVFLHSCSYTHALVHPTVFLHSCSYTHTLVHPSFFLHSCSYIYILLYIPLLYIHVLLHLHFSMLLSYTYTLLHPYSLHPIAILNSFILRLYLWLVYIFWGQYRLTCKLPSSWGCLKTGV